MLQLKNWIKGTSTAHSLPEAQRCMYASETTENFRLIAKLFALQSSHTLTSGDLASNDLQHELAEIGQFAEVAHGTVLPKFIWNNMNSLMKPTFPLDGYNALRGSDLVSAFHGSVAELQGYIAYRPQTKQLIVAFSGTSSVAQTFRNIDARMVPYPGAEGCAVHRGFWRLYNGVRSHTLGELSKALTQYDIQEIVCTGHSMGAVMCYLFALDVIAQDTTGDTSHNRPRALKLAVFGSPRVGNQALADHWRHIVAGHNTHGFLVKDYSVKGYNDGVPALPPYQLGFRHLSQTPLYFAYGRLYHILAAESECCAFPIESSVMKDSNLEHPLGGHNYYNGRDMEKFLRNMRWFDSKNVAEVDWKQYGDWLRKEEKKINGTSAEG